METYTEMKKKTKGVIKNIDYEDPVIKYRGQKVLRLAKIIADTRDISIGLNVAIDVFYTFYLPYPILVDKKEVGREGLLEYEIINSMLRSKYIHDIRCKTVADNLMSSIAASIFLSELERELTKYITSKDMLREKDLVEKIQQGENVIDKAVEKAMNNTKRDVDEARKLRLLIEGQQPGNVSMIAFEKYVPEIIKLARNTEVKKILEIVSGVKPWSINIPKRKHRSKHGEIVGYELGKDIERIVPSTLALPDELFYLRLLEGKLPLHQKILSQSYGPLYVLLDKCLPQDTLITMYNAEEKPISEVKPGDRVISFDINTLTFKESKVKKKYDNGVKPLIEIKTDMASLEVTINHLIPVYRPGIGLVTIPALFVMPGDYLLYSDDLKPRLAKVTSIVDKDYTDRVYDIRLEDNYYFIANNYIVHNSGSMDGTKILWAKAVALSLYMRALKEHREFYFRFFDSVPYPLAKIGKRPNAKQTLKLIEYIAMVRGSGGTDISRALLLACNDIRSGIVRGISDIVLITDGVDRIAEQLVNYNLKKANARLISVMIFGDNKSLKKISTKYLTVRKLSNEEILKVVEA